ncbi:MAG: MATE family efflux transporter [Bacteroidales bacterium]
MNDLRNDSVRKLLINLATPAIIAQIVNVLYNIIDRIFIGRMDQGEIAMAGIGVTFPIILLITAFSSLYGMGGAPLCAIQMGAGNKEKAEEIMTTAFSLQILTGIVLTILFLLFNEPLLWLFGASDATIGYATDYLNIYVLGTICVQVGLGMNPFINTQGYAKMGMLTIVIGALINLILDPILIFGLGMGVKGAATATVIAQTVSALWVFFFLSGKMSKLNLRLKYLRPAPRIVKQIMLLGVSPFIMQSTESLVLISLNTQLSKFGGDMAVGAMAIMTSLLQIMSLPMQGIAQGAQPIVSFNYGAGQYHRVRETVKLALKSALTYNILFCTTLLIFPSVFVKIFNDNPELVATTSRFIRIYFIGFTIFGGQTICQQVFVSLGQAKVSIFIATLRKIILLVPLVYILPPFFENKVTGVLTAEPISDLTSVTVTFILFARFYKKHLKDR